MLHFIDGYAEYYCAECLKHALDLCVSSECRALVVHVYYISMYTLNILVTLKDTTTTLTKMSYFTYKSLYY